MKENKKLNLLPQEVKDKYANKYILCVTAAVSAVLVLTLIWQYASMGYLSWQIRQIKAENERYNAQKEKITQLQSDVDGFKAFMAAYEDGCFPFYHFMWDMETNRPDGVSIISVDSPDRLINEGENKEPEQTEPAKEGEDNSGENTGQAEEKDNENIEEEQTPEGTPEPIMGEIAYSSDLAGQELTIRGYGKNQDDISKFIYALSNLSYITSVKITAIEEHPMPEGTYNIFEIKIMGGAPA